MTKQEILETLRSQRGKIAATEMAELLFQLCGCVPDTSVLVFGFGEAFPSIPIPKLKESLFWSRFGHGTLSDVEFNRLFSPWLDCATFDFGT